MLLPDGSPGGVVVQVTLSDTPVLLSDRSKTSSLPVLVDAVRRKRERRRSARRFRRSSRRGPGAREGDRWRRDERLGDPVDSGVSSDGLVRGAEGGAGKEEGTKVSDERFFCFDIRSGESMERRLTRQG